jgi:hypothetical protein
MESGQSIDSGCGVDEDKLDAVANQAVVTLLSLLCFLEPPPNSESKARLSFKFAAFASSPTYLAMRIFLQSSL